MHTHVIGFFCGIGVHMEQSEISLCFTLRRLRCTFSPEDSANLKAERAFAKGGRCVFAAVRLPNGISMGQRDNRLGESPLLIGIFCWTIRWDITGTLMRDELLLGHQWDIHPFPHPGTHVGTSVG